VLEATRDLVADRGFDAVTVEAIIERAGVGRQTVYRWWRSKAEIVAEAVLDRVIALPVPTAPPPGPALAALEEWVGQLARVLHAQHAAALVRGLVAAAATDAEASTEMYTLATGPAHDQLVTLLSAARAEGGVRDGIDPGTAADALIGAVLFSVLARRTIGDGFSDRLLDLVRA
jgi:AcrR family transcriptional regulator